MGVDALKVLVAHTSYQQQGGEDSVVTSEVELLRQHGHEVIEYRRSNDEVARLSLVVLASQTVWSRRTTAELDYLLRLHLPDVVHVHNTFPLMSPSLYWSAARVGVPVVQTLHNFRLICPQAMLLRDGRVCEDCIGHVPWRAAVHACYRGSAVQSAVLAGMVTLHRAFGTWCDKVTRYVALNEFCRRKFIEGGLPAAKVAVKPNFVDFGRPVQRKRSGFLFVGRMSKEKGISTLAKALQQLPNLSVRVAGSGPEAALLDGISGLKSLGHLSGAEVRDEMLRASAMILPSIWYENFPRTLVEAYASGLPVIASRLGALEELIEDGVTGLLFTPGDSDELASKLKWADANPSELAAMGQRAREHYELRYTAARNYDQLLRIYLEAIAECEQDRTPDE